MHVKTAIQKIVISEFDIWRAANLLIRQRGEKVELGAAKRHADILVDRGIDRLKNAAVAIVIEALEDCAANPPLFMSG
jgi:hypothetical protein